LISYAPNFEDVILMRAFRHVVDGFYIDVGASDPDLHSVTKAFYERGWRGINVEPLASNYEKLYTARPRDFNILAVAASESCPQSGPRQDNAVGCRTLADISKEHAPDVIHFLRISVDGAEADVIGSADFVKFRPLVVLVRAKQQVSQEPNFARWEPLLTSARYRHVHFDGLNRFYLAEEADVSLADALRTPPNMFDEFVTIREHELRARNAELLAANAAAEEAIHRNQLVKFELDQLKSSRRFRVACTLGLVPSVSLPPKKKSVKRNVQWGRSFFSKARNYLIAPLKKDLDKLVARDQQLVDVVERTLLTMTIELRRARERDDSDDEPGA